MRKRLLSLLISIALLASLTPTVFAATTPAVTLTYAYSYVEKGTPNTPTPGQYTSTNPYSVESLGQALELLAKGTYEKSIKKKTYTYTIDTAQPYVITISPTANLRETINSKVIFTANAPTETDSDGGSLTICNSSSVTIKSSSTMSSGYADTITFSQGIEVESGATLVLSSSVSNNTTKTSYIFEGDLIVNGTLEANDPGVVATLQTITFKNNSALKIAENASATLVSTNVTGENANPLIVNAGSLLIGTGAYDQKSPTITAAGTAIQTSGTLSLDSGTITSTSANSDKPLIEVTGGEIKLEKEQTTDADDTDDIPVPTLTAPSAAPAILVKENASLTVGAGNITSTNNDQPAIVVESGSVTITTEDQYSEKASELIPTITSNGGKAVDLKAGVTVTNKAKVTAKVNEENDAAGENYIDNSGNIILAKGAANGDNIMNAAVILPDGTIIEGSDDAAPTVETDNEGKTTVTVPEGGSVTTPGEEPVTWNKGGSVESGDTTTTKPNASGVTMSSENLNLVYDGDNNTATLTATIVPAGAKGTISWSSSDTGVATVTEGENNTATVNAVSTGKATITVTVKDNSGNELATATCTVNVSKEPVPATGITIDPDSTTIYVGRTEQLKATLTPVESTDSVTWSSSDPDVATVDEHGVVTAVKKGTATITATANDSVFATCEVTVKKKSSSGGSSSSDSYSVSTVKAEDGKITVSPSKAEKGDTVTITVKPDAGYVLDELVITDKKGNEIDYKAKGDNKFTFKMPASKVEIEAIFAPEKEEERTIVLTLGSTAANVFGTPVINDVAPIARNNRTMLPIRFIAEALGARVDWDAANQKVTIVRDTLVIEIFLGSDVAYVNGQPVQLDSPAFAENNRTYLPLRFVAENLGAVVDWDASTQTVTITAN